MNVECDGLVYPEPRRAAAFEPVAALEKFDASSYTCCA